VVLLEVADVAGSLAYVGGLLRSARAYYARGHWPSGSARCTVRHNGAVVECGKPAYVRFTFRCRTCGRAQADRWVCTVKELPSVCRSCGARGHSDELCEVEEAHLADGDLLRWSLLAGLVWPLRLPLALVKWYVTGGVRDGAGPRRPLTDPETVRLLEELNQIGKFPELSEGEETRGTG
jgi:hypothetical protein